MKHSLLLFAIFIAFFSHAQEVLFKDNLFDNSDISVEVIDYDDFTVIDFGIEDDSATIYKWKYEVILDAFMKRFDTLKKSDERTDSIADGSIIREAGRVFYDVQVKKTLAEAKVKGPVAGTIGFEHKEVFVRRHFDYKERYKKDLKEARRIFRKTDLDTCHYKYLKKGAHGKKMIDLYYSAEEEHSRHFLKKHGLKSFTQANVDGIFSAYEYEEENRDQDLLDVLSYLDYQKQIDNEENVDSMQLTIEYLNGLIQRQVTDSLNTDMQLKIISRKLDNIKYDRFWSMTPAELDEEIKKDTVAADFFKLREEFDIQVSSFRGISEKLFELTDDRNILEMQVRGINRTREEISGKQSLLKEKLIKYKEKYRLEKTEDFRRLKDDLQNSTVASALGKHQYNTHMLRLSIDSISVDITKTFIESIAVYGRIMPREEDKQQGHFRNSAVMFYNHVPIGISTLTSVDKSLSNVTLFATIGNHVYELDIKDVIAFYNPVLMNGRSDLSPADTSLTVVKELGLQTVSLNKTPTQKLFEMKVYSDFIGLNGTTPNGLVQLELSKEMYLNSGKYSWTWKSGFYLNNSFGTYISPFFTLSKLEKTNKFLEMRDSSVQTLQLKRHEMFSVGADMNLYSLGIPRWKTQLYFDPGVAFGRIGLVDSFYNADSVRIGREFGVNSIAFKATGKVVFQTDERYFFDMRLSWQWYKLLDGNVYQVKEVYGEDLNKRQQFQSKVLFNIGLNAGFAPTKDTRGKLFVRYNYYGLAMRKTMQGFSQIQLGYSYYLNN